MRKHTYTHLLFDLDGTLTDPKNGIINSVLYAIENLGLPHISQEKLVHFIGPPIQDSFRNTFHLSEEKTWEAVSIFREYFAKKGMYENELYPGIPELLKKLQNSGKLLFLATSKPTTFSETILKHFSLDTHFTKIIGANLDGSRSSKREIITEILSQYPKESKREFVMIGDRKFDIDAANSVGIDSIAVLFGYGTKKELENSKPTYTVETVKDLENLLT